MLDQGIQAFKDDANASSANQRTADYGAGMQTARGLIGPDTNFESRLGNPMQEAIRTKYAREYDNTERALSAKLRRAGQDDHLKKLSVANQLAEEESVMNMRKAELERKKRAMKRQARAGVIGTALGLVGAAAGAAIGGPAGASAGYMIGAGTGAMAAGS